MVAGEELPYAVSLEAGGGGGSKTVCMVTVIKARCMLLGLFAHVPVVSITALQETRVPSARRRYFWRTVPRMSAKVGSSSFWMIRPILHRRKARRCGPADASLGRSRRTRSHLRQVSSAADVMAARSSERNSKMNSSGSIPGQPTVLTTNKRVISEAMPDRTVHKYWKKNSTGAAQARTAEVEVSTLGEVLSSIDSVSRSAGSALLSAAASLGDGKSLPRAAAVG